MKNYSPIIDGKDIVTKEFVESISGNEYFSTIPIGCVIANASNTVYNGFLLCDGTSYLVEEYPELYEIIGNKYGGDANNFNVPNLVDKFIQGDNTSGTEKDAGLPNIVGTMGAVVTGGGYDTQNSGALYWKENVETAQTWGSTNGYRTSYGLDASLSNSIYGNSDTVQPPALTMIYIIKAKHTNEGTDVNVELTDEVINQINLTVDKKTENLETKIGNPKNLETEDKSSLVNAINEVVNNSGSKNVQMTTTVLCNSTSSESAITFSESADNYDLIIGTVEFLYKSGSTEVTYIENVVWSSKFGSLTQVLPCSKEGSANSYTLSMSNKNVRVYQSGYTSRIQSITAKLYGVKFLIS